MSLDGPEVHGVHRHKPLASWVEILLSVSALVVSFASIAIALHHGQIMEKLVQANSLPYVEGGPSDATPEGKQRLSVDLANRGVGPANVQSLKIKVAGRYVTSVRDLVAAVLGPQEAPRAEASLRAIKNVVRTRFISGNSSQMIFAIPRTDENAPYWDKLDEALPKASLEFCYCSVFNECWAVKDQDRQKVKQCVRDEPHEFTP